MISTLTDLRVGTAIIVDNEPYLIVENSFMKTAQRRPVMRTKLKNLINGKTMERTFRQGESVDEADLSKKKASFTHVENEQYNFMDNESFEQFFLNPDQLVGKAAYLKEGLEVDVLYFNDAPVAVSLPQKIQYKVVEAPDAVKGNSAGGNVTKEIVLENGLKIRAPMFIKSGEEILVNTDDGEYVGRASE